jgi:hypothetical protein
MVGEVQISQWGEGGGGSEEEEWVHCHRPWRSGGLRRSQRGGKRGGTLTWEVLGGWFVVRVLAQFFVPQIYNIRAEIWSITK